MKKLLIGIGIVLLVVVVTVVGLFTWVTSEGFLRNHVLGAIREETGKPAEVEKIDLKLFKKVEITGLVIGAEPDPMARIPVLRVRYSLMDLLFKNTLRINECTLKDAELTLRQEDMTEDVEKEKTPRKEKKEGKPRKLFVENVNVENLSLHFISRGEGVDREVHVREASFSLPLLKNGEPFDLGFGAIVEAVEAGESQFKGKAEARVEGMVGKKGWNGRLDRLTAALHHQGKELIALRISEAIRFSERGLEGERTDVPVVFSVTDFNIQDWLALVPESAGLETAAGVINLQSEMTLDGESRQVTGAVSLRAENLSFRMASGMELKTISLVSATDISASSEGPLTLRGLSLKLLRAGKSLLDVEGGATLWSQTADEEKKSTLRLESRAPVALDPLLALYTPAEETAEDEAPASADFPWLEITLVVPEASYKGLTAGDVALVAELRGQTIAVKPSSLTLAGGELAFDGTIDSAGTSPGYNLNARLNGVAFAPFIQAFLAKPPVALTGGLQSATLQAQGTGFSKKQLMETLEASLDFDVDQLNVSRMEGFAATAVDALLLTQFGIRRDQLTFADGEGALSFSDGTLRLQNVNLSGASLGLGAQGRLQLAGGIHPDMVLKFHFPAQIGERLARQGLKLTKRDKGGYTAPPLELVGQFWKRENLARLALQYGAKTGRVDPRLGQASEALDALEKLKSKDGQPADPAAAVEGVLNLMEGMRGRQDEGEDEEAEGENGNEKEGGKEDKAREAVRGILGL